MSYPDEMCWHTRPLPPDRFQIEYQWQAFDGPYAIDAQRIFWRDAFNDLSENVDLRFDFEKRTYRVLGSRWRVAAVPCFPAYSLARRWLSNT